MANESLRDIFDGCEDATRAINGAQTVGTIIYDCTMGESKETWSDSFLEDLYDAQKVLLEAAKNHIARVQHAHWMNNAIAGKYGEEARAKALAALADESQRVVA